MAAVGAGAALSGHLGEISVADLLQFIHLGERTGRLDVFHDADCASVTFSGGRIVNAWGPGARRLGELLVEAGALPAGALEEALLQQAAQPSPPPLGELLVSMNLVQQALLDRVVSLQVGSIVQHIVGWQSGRFQFSDGSAPAVNPLPFDPLDALPAVELNTQKVLLDALRLSDERNRTKTTPDPVRARAGGREVTAGPRQPPPVAGQEKTPLRSPVETPGTAATAGKTPGQELFVVSEDAAFVAQLVAAAHLRGTNASRLFLFEAQGRLTGHPLMVLDARAGVGVVEGIATVRRACPGAAIIVVLNPGSDPSAAYGNGAVAVLPPEANAVLACALSIGAHQRGVARSPQSAQRAGLARLRRVFEDLRSGLASTTITLNLMSIISESAERAVLFLATEHELGVLGAFGAGQDGRALAEHTRGLSFPVQRDSLLAEVLLRGQARTVSYDEANLPSALAQMLGRPRSGQVALFPVLGASRVIAVVYADNGPRPQPVAGVEILEIAAAQVGLAFENELLRRRLGLPRD